MSHFFKGKKARAETKMLDVPAYKKVRDTLSKWFSGQIGQTGPVYEGEIIPPATSYQEEALPYMEEYASSPVNPELVNLAAGEYKKTLQGQYDPTKSLYYQAMREAAKQNLSDTLSRIGSEAAGAGRYWTDARLSQQAGSERRMTNYLNQLLGGLTERERARRLNAAVPAAQLGYSMQLAPLTKAENIFNVGNLFRNIQAAKDQAAYEQWLRSVYEYPLKIAQLATGFQATKPPEWQTITYPGRPSAFSRLLPVAATAGLGALNPALLGASSALQGASLGALAGLTGHVPSIIINPLSLSKKSNE